MDKKNWLWISIFVVCAFGISFVLSKTAKRITGERDIYLSPCPIRIVSIDYYSTEILCDLGVVDKIVAIGKLKKESPYYQILKSKPPVGGDMTNVNLELLLGFKPDLVFCWKGQSDILKERGLNIFPVGTYDVEGIMKLVKDIGAIVGKEKEAKKIVSNMQTRINVVAEFILQKLKKIKSRPLVYFEAHSLGKSRSSGSLTHDLITRAGGINIAGSEPVAFPLLSQEFIITKNPDVIIVEDYGATPEEIKKRDGWKNIKAVKNNRIFVSPGYFTGYTPRCLDGLEQYAKWFYPEQ
ncbi:MAG: ABC transporter substrate-binding protein [Elusimicrobia bacterium]|nr:ABC transporter substrate-binding protein [Elusimicrobiota bacterium]